MKHVVNIQQNSPEWHTLRKTKITATDACAIMNVSKWKTRTQLYYEKLSDESPIAPTERMQRGLDLEPIARSLFSMQTGIFVEPAVVVKDWAMASLDGMNEAGTEIVEIKCPGAKDHATACEGKVPVHYYPQIQHQLYVTDLQEAHYFSFDGIDGVVVKVKRDDEYINKMVQQEKEFYEYMIKQTPPSILENEYIEREDEQWKQFALRWKSVNQYIKELEKEEEDLREKLVLISGQCNTRGSGVTLCQINRKGSVDYSKIPEMKHINLDDYRKAPTMSWRLTAI